MMRLRFLISSLLVLFLFGCSEPEEKNETNYKSKYNIVDNTKLKKLDNEFRNFGLLSFSYATVVSQQDICDIFEESVSQSNNEELKKIMDGKLKECNFYRKLYEVVIPNFSNINNSNYINHYYFEFRGEDSESSLTNRIGIFLDLENCNKFKEVFLDNELGFTSNCKKLKSTKL